MFKKHFVFLLILFAFMPACSYLQKQFVQFKLASARDKIAQKVTYTPPPPPYKPKNSQKLDKLWKHTNDHSSISYFSSCSQNHKDLSFSEIQQNILSEVPQWKLLSTQTSPHFLKSHFQVIGDNYETFNSIHIFKTKSCFFVLNFVAVSLKNFRKNKSLFENFIKGFKAL